MDKLLFLSGSQFPHLKNGGGVGAVDQMKVRVKFKAYESSLEQITEVLCLSFLICKRGI